VSNRPSNRRPRSDESADPKADPTPAAAEPDEKPVKQPSKPPPPQVDVLFLRPSGAQGKLEVEVGKTRIKGSSLVSAKLRIDTYPVRWRTLPDGEWHSVGKLTVDKQPADKGYQVNLAPTSMTVAFMHVGRPK
jgi:hypothetical protein